MNFLIVLTHFIATFPRLLSQNNQLACAERNPKVFLRTLILVFVKGRNSGSICLLRLSTRSLISWWFCKYYLWWQLHKFTECRVQWIVSVSNAFILFTDAKVQYFCYQMKWFLEKQALAFLTPPPNMTTNTVLHCRKQVLAQVSVLSPRLHKWFNPRKSKFFYLSAVYIFPIIWMETKQNKISHHSSVSF